MVSIGPTIGIKGESTYRQGIMRIISQTKALNAEMELMTAKFKENESAMSKNKKLAEEYAKILGSAKQELGKMQDALGKAIVKHDEAKEKQAKLNAELEEAKKQYGETSKEVKALEKELDKADNEVEKSGKNVEQWKEKVAQAETEVVNWQKKLDEANNTLKHFGEDAIEVGNKISGVGEAMTKYITVPLTALGTAAIKASSDFTDGMAKIYTIAQEGQKPMAEMRGELERLSADTAFSLDDLTEAAYQAVSASVKTEDAVGFVSDAARLARAGFTDTTTSVDLLTTAINAYGYTAKDAAYISDVLLKTQNDGKTIVSELAGVMGTVIPTAAAYNVSLENLAAAYVVTTKQGVNTARATTFLNSMFTELERSNSTVAKTLKSKTGKSFAELMGEGKSLGDVLGILYDSVKKDDEAFAQLWGNVRAGRGGLALVNMGIDNFNTALERVSDSAGQTQYALDVLETPSLKAKRAMNQLKIVGIELGDSLIERLSPTFERLVGTIGSVADAFIKMDDDTLSAITTFGLATAAIGPTVFAIGKMIEGVGKLAIWFTNLQAGVYGILPVLGLATVAFFELGAAAWLMQDKRLKAIDAEYNLSSAIEESVRKTEALKQSHENFAISILETERATLEQIDTIRELSGQYNELIDKNGKVKKGEEEKAKTILTQLAEAMGVEVSEVKKLIEKNGQFGESLEKNIQQIKKRAEMAVYEEKYKEAIERKLAAQEAYDQELKALEEQNKKTKEAQDHYNKALEEYNAHLEDGTAKTGGYEDALERATEELATAKAAEGKMNDAIAETKTVLDDATRAADIYGEKLETGLEEGTKKGADGVKEGGKAVKSEAEKLAKEAVEKMKVDGRDVGRYIVDGVAKGIDSNSEIVQKAAKRAASAAIRSMKSTLDINSPSRVMEELGEYTGEGFALGIESWVGKTARAANDLANAAVMTSNRMNRYAAMGDTYNNKNISAPISVAVNVNGGADNYYSLAETIAQRINEAIAIQEEVFV